MSLIEIVSPGNKSSRVAFRKFIEKAHEFLRAGVNLLIIDLFPPGPRDPLGIHRAIWDEFYQEDDFVNPPEKPLTLASYVPGDSNIGCAPIAYVEPIGYGDQLPDMAAYLDVAYYVPVPLEQTYQFSWDVSPLALREFVEQSS